MAKQVINVGTSANDGTGDKNRVAFQKCNANFTELYDAIPPAQQYKFLLSQSGGDDPQTATSGSLTQGVTYEIVAFETGDNFIPSGAPNNDVGTKWIANGVAPTWSNGSEIGWNNGAPYIIGEITANTFGRVWFERIDVGYYQIKSNGLFTDGTIDFGSTSALVVGDAAFILRSNKDADFIEFTTATPSLVYQDSMIVENVVTLYKYTQF